MDESTCWRPVALRRRLLLITLVAIQGAAGTLLFYQVLPGQADNWAIATLLFVFGILFAWIGVGFWTALCGFIALRFGGDPWSLSRRYASSPPTSGPLAPTAVVLPICHEPVQRTLAGLSAIYRELEEYGQANAVDFYVLSDSRDPEVWLEEQATCARLQSELGAHNRLFYRRRNRNLNHKSGNIADFLRRWGRQYRYMVVLDADSLLSASCITRLIELMEFRPQAGIIQTTPRLARGRSRFARLQQFANRCYGRLYGAGLSAIQLGEATYWGHNAIIRVAPFMAHCGLRRLQGPGLFSGPVLSHDFVEAGLMGRAGYEVWLEPAIAGSFEESPPTLEDDLVRERRWCRGNLQHIWLLATLRNLSFTHRMALVTGIFSYLASPLWLVFLGLSGYVTLAGPLNTPTMPGVLASADWGTGKDFLLVGVTALLLFGPRLLALADQTLARRASLFGGPLRLFASTLLETLAALALAPVRMFAHTLYVIRAVLNLSLGWQGQNRTGRTKLNTSVRHFGLAMASAALTLGLVQWQAPALTPWILSVSLPVLLSPILANWLNGSPSSRYWLQVPEDRQVPPVIEKAALRRDFVRRWERLNWFEQLVLSPVRARSPNAPAISGQKRQALLELVKRCAEQGSADLSQREVSLICRHPMALEELHLRAWSSEPDTPWGQALERMIQSMEHHPAPARASARPRFEETLWIDAAS